MKISLAIDRFEGDAKDIAVLLADDGTAIDVPRALLPMGVKAGDILAVTIEHDADATRQVAAKTKKVRDPVKASAPARSPSCKRPRPPAARGWPLLGCPSPSRFGRDRRAGGLDPRVRLGLRISAGVAIMRPPSHRRRPVFMVG